MKSMMKARTIFAALMIAGAGIAPAFAEDQPVTFDRQAVFAASEVPADAIVVEIDQLKYQTPELTVKVGDTVTWVNKEVMPHDVAFNPGPVGPAILVGGMMMKDQAFSVTFNEPGTYDYHCSPHPFMRGKVIVEE